LTGRFGVIIKRDLSDDVRQVDHAWNDGELVVLLLWKWTVVVLVEPKRVRPPQGETGLDLEREQTPDKLVFSTDAAY
jgi:hypothetical protein